MSFNHPARQSIVPNLVRKEHLLNAFSLDSGSVMASRVIAMPIAGYLIGAIGVAPIFGLRAVGALLAICWLLFAKIPSTPPAARKEAPRRNLTEGVHYLRAHIVILTLVVLYLLPRVSTVSYVNFLPLFAVDILHVGASGYGFLQAAPGLGALISLIILASLGNLRHRECCFLVSAWSWVLC